MIKNLMALTCRAPSAQAARAQGLTKKDVKRLSATAESPKGHLKLAAYYRAEADPLDTQASGYEEAAAAYWRGPTRISWPRAHEAATSSLPKDFGMNQKPIACWRHHRRRWHGTPSLRCRRNHRRWEGYVTRALPGAGRLVRGRGHNLRAKCMSHCRWGGEILSSILL